MRRKFGKREFFVTILVGVIIEVVAGLVLPYTSLVAQTWDWAVAGVVAAGTWSGTNHLVAGWMIVVLVVLSSIALIAGIGLAYLALTQRKDGVDTNWNFQGYNADVIGNLHWKWSWNLGHIQNLWCFCPRCDAELSPIEGLGVTEFVCENCTRYLDNNFDPMQTRPPVARQHGDMSYIVQATEREIRRRIRTGEANRRNVT